MGWGNWKWTFKVFSHWLQPWLLRIFLLWHLLYTRLHSFRDTMLFFYTFSVPHILGEGKELLVPRGILTGLCEHLICQQWVSGFQPGKFSCPFAINASLDWTVPAVKAAGKWETLSENMGFDDHMELSHLHCPKHSSLLSSESHTCKFTFSFTFILAPTLTSFNSFNPSMQLSS